MHSSSLTGGRVTVVACVRSFESAYIPVLEMMCIGRIIWCKQAC